MLYTVCSLLAQSWNSCPKSLNMHWNNMDSHFVVQTNYIHHSWCLLIAEGFAHKQITPTWKYKRALCWEKKPQPSYYIQVNTNMPQPYLAMSALGITTNTSYFCVFFAAFPHRYNTYILLCNLKWTLEKKTNGIFRIRYTHMQCRKTVNVWHHMEISNELILIFSVSGRAR